MNIRNALPEDAEKLMELMKHVEESGFMLFEPGERQSSLEIFEKRIGSLGEGSAIFIAEEQSEYHGYLFAMGESVNRKRHSVYVALGIREEHRGKGIGAQLFEVLEKWAVGKQLRRIELTVMESNAAGLALYKKAGFEIEGIKRDSLLIDGRFANEYYMAKILD